MMKTHPVSKPYVLRAMEASHGAALLFADDEAVCETMKPASTIGSALHMAVSGEELVSVLTAKAEAIIMNLLKDYMKKREVATERRCVTDL